MKKISVITSAMLVILSLLTGCGSGGNTATTGAKGDTPKGDTYTLKIGNTVSDVDPFNVAYNEFKKQVETQSEGRIKVEIYSNGSIGESDADVLDKVRAGTLQMGNTTPNCLAALSAIDDYYVYGIPYLMSSDEELNLVGESQWINDLNKEFLDTTGVKIFDGGGVNMGWFGFSSTKDTITKIDDLKNKSIRINQTNQMIALAEGAKINPQFIVFSEVYTALAQGTVDGMVTNMPLYYSNGFYDQVKSILSTKCGTSYHFYVMNDKFYSELPKDLQGIVDENVSKMIAQTRSLEETYLEQAIGEMSKAKVLITQASAEDEQTLKDISMNKVWWDPNTSLTSVENVNKVLEILGHESEQKK